MFEDSEIKRIVLVEDEEGIFYSTKEYFDEHYECEFTPENSTLLDASSIYIKQKKWCIYFCSSSKEALKTIVYQNYIYDEPVCMVVTDLLMPDQTGYWLIDSINHFNVNLCKVVLSAYKDIQVVDSLIGRNVFKIIAKNELHVEQNGRAIIDISILERKIEEIIEIQKKLSSRTTVTVDKQKSDYTYLRWYTLESKLESLSLGHMDNSVIKILRQKFGRDKSKEN